MRPSTVTRCTIANELLRRRKHLEPDDTSRTSYDLSNHRHSTTASPARSSAVETGYENLTQWKLPPPAVSIDSGAEVVGSVVQDDRRRNAPANQTQRKFMGCYVISCPCNIKLR
jgi:hypothetical protein